MKWKIVTGIALASLLASIGASAETVTQKQAAGIAQTFFNAMNGRVVPSPKMVWNGRQLTTDRLFAPFYIYNHPAGGYVIISADTKAYPVLGYSRTGRFDRGAMDENDNRLLTQYAHEIELVRYDPAQPERAVAAWRNLPQYITRMLENPYDTPEYARLDADSRDLLEAVDRRNSAVMMPSAVEFEYNIPTLFRDATLEDVLADGGSDEEEVPFRFFEQFLSEVKGAEATRLASIEEIANPSHPVVNYLGGAHFDIRYPAPILETVVYSLDGMRRMQRSYRGETSISADLSALPSGYCILMALSEDGSIYGLKLYR